MNFLGPEISFDDDFPKNYKKATMGHVLVAQVGRPKEDAKGYRLLRL
jgi:hypothetical protein